eukprot:tig00001333_g8202.t1
MSSISAFSVVAPVQHRFGRRVGGFAAEVQLARTRGPSSHKRFFASSRGPVCPDRHFVVRCADGEAAMPDREVPFPLEREASRVLFNAINLMVAKRVVNSMEAEEAQAFRDFFARHSLRQEPKAFIQALFKEMPSVANEFITAQEQFVEQLELGMVPEMMMEGLERGKMEVMREYIKESTDEEKRTPPPEEKGPDGGPGWLGRDRLFTKMPGAKPPSS